MNKLTNVKLVTWSLIILVIATAYLAWSFYSHLGVLSNKIALLDAKLASTTAQLNKNITDSHLSLSQEIGQQKNNVGDIQQKLGTYSQQVNSYTNTVSTLQKLSKTDPQLLSKYSKVFFLSENYSPERLVAIPNQYSYSDSKVLKFHALAWPFLQQMLDDAKKSGVQMYADSAYRSFDEQQALKVEYKVVYGAGTANSFSADQGYSEHQLGTTLDIIAPGQGGELDGFENTKAYAWLMANAYRYGFILSYPKDNKFYIFEPWHWRFVGIKLATDLHNQNKHFYDLDQRDIDNYLASIFDQTN